MTVTRWFYDTEFVEREDGRAIDLVSVGFISEDGKRSYEAVCTDFDREQALPWVRKNVLDKLPSQSSPLWKSRERIKIDLEELLLSNDETPELWAWYAAYDHVVFCQLWGRMPDLPRRIPRFTHDLRQLWEERGSIDLPRQTDGHHTALADAKHNLVRWKLINSAPAPRP